MDNIELFEELGKIRDEADMTGDYKEGNKAFKKTERIFELAQNSSKSEQFYTTILNTCKNQMTLVTCCVHMMRLSIFPKLAREKLVEISSKEKRMGLSSLEAEMFLREWDKGNIKPVR